jgi:hypothetical protein
MDKGQDEAGRVVVEAAGDVAEEVVAEGGAAVEGLPIQKISPPLTPIQGLGRRENAGWNLTVDSAPVSDAQTHHPKSTR